MQYFRSLWKTDALFLIVVKKCVVPLVIVKNCALLSIFVKNCVFSSVVVKSCALSSIIVKNCVFSSVFVKKCVYFSMNVRICVSRIVKFCDCDFGDLEVPLLKILQLETSKSRGWSQIKYFSNYLILKQVNGDFQ